MFLLEEDLNAWKAAIGEHRVDKRQKCFVIAIGCDLMFTDLNREDTSNWYFWSMLGRPGGRCLILWAAWTESSNSPSWCPMTLQLDPFVVFFQEVIAFTLDILDSRVGQCSRCKIVGGAGERCPEEVPQALPENRVSLTRAPKQFKYQKGRNPPQPILLSEFITFVELHD